MTTALCTRCDELTAAVEAAHEQTLNALTEQPPRPLDAVVWMSAHLAAVQRVLHPLLDGTELHEQLQVARRLHVALRALEQHAAGDARVAGHRADDHRSHVLSLLVAHAATEQTLLERLTSSLEPRECERLAERYRQAIATGPTRPHPHLRSVGPLGPGVLRLQALRDRVLDAMDGRRVPLPRRARPQREPGRWGRYLLGG